MSEYNPIIDYEFVIPGGNPPGYPQVKREDSFASVPFAEPYVERRRAFLDFICQNPAPENFKAPYYEIARMACGMVPHEGVLEAGLAYIDARKDCSDFVLHSILRLLYQFPDSELLSREFYTRAKKTVLNFKYWPDEPGIDALCTWTENHYILYNAAAYLAGQLYPDEIFENSGQSGKQKMETSRKRIFRWLDLRFRTGFSEWLSHIYYDEDLTALINLVAFSEDEEIVRKAKGIIDLLLLDMVLHHHRGVFGSSHGRSYTPAKKWAGLEATSATMKLLFGVGCFSIDENMSAVLFALTEGLRVPELLHNVFVEAKNACFENRQCMGIRVEEAERWGLEIDNNEDGMHLLTLESYTHPKTIRQTIKMFDDFTWWQNPFFKPFDSHKSLLKMFGKLNLTGNLAAILEKDICRNTREEVNLYTYRTPDYMLSTAQDYRKGYGGDQQHIWQATLGHEAVCFSTHPARKEGATPNYWSGSGLLPRAAQTKNVSIIICRIRKMPALYVPVRMFFTHAWLPKDRFDEIHEDNNWVFARKGNGYLALFSSQPTRWQDEPGEDQDRELIAEGRDQVWICELGRQADDGTFSEFAEKILAARVLVDGLSVVYDSPSQGKMCFGWQGPLRVNENEVELHGYPRYENPFIEADFDPQEITIKCGKEKISLLRE